MGKKTVLLIIDAQVNMFDEAEPVHKAGTVLSNLQVLCRKAHDSGIPIFFVRHDGGRDAPDEFNTPGWQLHPQLTTRAADVFINKRRPDAFRDTQLKDKLDRRGAGKLVIAGMQTDFCVNATTRRAVKFGYCVTLVSDAHSTFDTQDRTAAEIIDEHNIALGKIAAIVSTDDMAF